jgi:DNA polymerase-1
MQHTLGDDRPKIGANLYYDYGWMKQEGVQVGGTQYDVQYAEALLNSETPRVDLDSLGARYLGAGKTTSQLYRWLADYFGGQPGQKQRKHIYRAPPRLVGPYAEEDAGLPIRVLERQWAKLSEWGMLDLYEMECALIPLLVDMRFKGAPVDLDYASKLHDELAGDIKELDAKLAHVAGFEVNVNASDSLAKAFDVLGVRYPRTKPTKNAPHGNPSFIKEWLEGHDHPFAQLVTDRRAHEKIRGTFLESYILNSHVNGRIHGEFHPLKGEGYGARSGRFASRNPNLQNIPTRTELGKRVRKAFIATGQWRKFDYSQIEYRLLANHAVGAGADEIRRKYNADPTTDYHKATQALVLELTGLDIERPKIKNINFGFIYGMSQARLARQLGLDDATAQHLFTSYHTAVPFARATMDACAGEVNSQGWVSTFAGRRSQFAKWTSRQWRDDAPPMDFEDAVMQYGRVKRAFTHKALNRKLQGGAADIMKRAMVAAYKSGLFNTLGTPLLTVHDELDFDDIGAPADAWRELAHVMETCAPELNVPIIVDHEIGPSWGSVEEMRLVA